MARTISQLTVFVSSPGGLDQDRAAVESAVGEANRILAAEGISLSPFLWEKDAVPGRGRETAQDKINQKLENDVDIFMLFMHHRVGGATKNYISGTVEEFEIVHNLIESGKKIIEVCIYFNVSPISPLVDIKQLKSVQDFRKRVQGLPYLTRDYEQAVDLRLSMVGHLVEKARSIAGQNDGSKEAGGVAKSAGVQGLFQGLLDEDEDAESDSLGPLDYEDIATKKMTEVGALVTKIGKVVESFSPLVDAHMEKINKASELAKLGVAIDRRGLIDDFAQTLEGHNLAILPIVDEIEDQLPAGSSASLGLVQEWPIESEEGAAAVQEFLTVVGTANSSMKGFADVIAKLQVTLQEWPGLTLKLKKARRRAVTLYARLHSLLSDSSRVFEGAVRIGEERLANRTNSSADL